MSERERLEVERQIARDLNFEGQSLEEMRAAYEGICRRYQVHDGFIENAISSSDFAALHLKNKSNTTTSTRPILLYCHGGGYVMGSPASHAGLVSHLAASAGCDALLIGYRLAPEHPYPAPIEDVVAAYGWLVRNGYSASRIAFVGDSAGAALAIAAMLRIRDNGETLPACAVLFSPFADLTASGESMTTKADVDVMVERGTVSSVAETYLAGGDPRDPYASPIFGDLVGFPPLLVHVGTYEVLLDDALRLVRCAAIADVAVQLRAWPKLPHVWQLFAYMLEEGRESIAEAGNFVAETLQVNRGSSQ